MNLVTFTVDEANRLVPELETRIRRLVEGKREFDRLQNRIDVLSVAVAGASRANPDTQELIELNRRRNKLAEGISEEIAAVHGHGCLVKDLERGLVDFYALAGDRLIFLCWQLGEPEIAHWHSLDGGFEQRQPLQSEPE